MYHRTAGELASGSSLLLGNSHCVRLQKRYVHWRGEDYCVTWHPTSGEVFVTCGTDKYCGKARDMQKAMDSALSWLNSHPTEGASQSPAGALTFRYTAHPLNP